jgi:hypothetical protein
MLCIGYKMRMLRIGYKLQILRFAQDDRASHGQL